MKRLEWTALLFWFGAVPWLAFLVFAVFHLMARVEALEAEHAPAEDAVPESDSDTGETQRERRIRLGLPVIE